MKVGSRLCEAGACLIMRPEEATAMMDEGIMLWLVNKDVLKKGRSRLLKDGEKIMTMPGRSLENLHPDSIRIALHAECGMPLPEAKMLDRKSLVVEVYRRRKCRTAQQATSRS